MKKYIKLLFVLTMVLLVTGCGNKEEKEIGNLAYECIQKRADASGKYERETTYKIYSKDAENVSIAEIKDVFKSDDEDILKYFENGEKSSYESINETYGGYEVSSNLENDNLTIDVKINYNKFDVKTYGKDVETMQKYISDDKLTLEGLKKLYESYGATCTKKES